MFDNTRHSLNIDYFSCANQVTGWQLIELFVGCFLACDNEPSQEKQDFYRSQVIGLLLDAIEGGASEFKEIQSGEERFRVVDHEGTLRGHNYGCIESSPKEAIPWAIKAGIPIPEKLSSSFPLNLSNTNTRAEESSDTDVLPPSSQDEQISTFVSGLSVSNIKDPAIYDLDRGVQESAIKFYGGIYAGILMGRFRMQITKPELQGYLMQMGFKKELDIKEDVFKSIWKAIPEGLKLPGRKPGNK